jgi:hypothetical protein
MWWRQGKITADKYILTTRSLESWLKSIRSHWARNGHKYHEHRIKAPALWEMRNYFYNGQVYDQSIFADAFIKHKNEVTAKANPLLVFNLCDGDGWEPLCGFLDKPIPDYPFPHVNRTGRPEHVPPNVEERCVLN